MKKKFTSLMLMLFCAVTAWAFEPGTNITDLSDLTDGGYVCFKNVGQNKYIYENTDGRIITGVEASTLSYVWQVHVEEGGKYSFSSILGNYFSTPLDAQDVYTVAVDNEAKDEFTITAHSEDNTKWKLQSSNNTEIYWDCQSARFVGWYGSGNNSQYEIIPVSVTTEEIETYIDSYWSNFVEAVRTAAMSEVQLLATESLIYPAAQSTVDQIEAVQLAGNTATQANEAVATINGYVATYKTKAYKALAGKYFTLYTPGRTAYAKMTASGTGNAGTASTPDVIWQFVENNGSVNIYNPYIGKYLVMNSTNAMTVTANQAEAGAFDITVASAPSNEDAKIGFKSNDWYIHLNGHLLGWYSGGASEWTVAEVTDFSTMVEAYKLSSVATLESWKTLTVVFDAELIDAAKTAIDAISTTDWATFAAIDAELVKVTDAVAAKMFTFQTIATDANRSGVWVSADMTVNKAIGADTQDYNAIWSLQHAGGTSFYMFNELNQVYMGAPAGECALTAEPVATYSFEIINAANNVVEMKSDGGTLHASNWASNALINWDGDEDASRWMVNIVDVTKDIKDLLATIDADDYAEVPALGQYPKAAYDALVAAQTTSKTVEDVEAAIAAFKATKNSPVFTIDGVIDYAAGKSIYDNPASTNGQGNTHYFKLTNVYDKTMWWALDMTETTVGVIESVGIRNVGTGAGFWGSSTIKITETSENDAADGIFLFYTTGNETPIHAQNTNQLITRWNDTGATSGSAWKFTYIGNTYDLKDKTITYIYKYGENELAREEVNAIVGLPYPAATATLPLGYTATNLEGNVSKDDTEKIITCELNEAAIPFEYYNSFDAVEQWYYLRLKNQSYLYYEAENDVLDATKTEYDKENRVAYAWAFVGDPLNGFQVVNKKAAETMGLKAAAEGAVVGMDGHTFKFTTASDYLESGFFMAATNGERNERFNMQNGKVVYWTGADLGSTFTVEACPFGPVAELRALIGEAEALKTTVDANIGDKIGEYTQATADALAAAIVTAQGKVDDPTDDDVTALQSVIDGTKVILPTAGKYYQLRSAVAFAQTKAVYSDGSKLMWKTLNEADKTFYWQTVENEGGIALKNAADGKFMNGNTTQSGAWSVSDTPANIEVQIFSKEENANGYQYGVILDNWQLHAQNHGEGSGTNGTIVSYNTDAPSSASAWYLVEVGKPITYIYKHGDIELAREVVNQFVGNPYPAATAILPLGYTATNLEGNVSQEDTEKTIACEFNQAVIPFEYYESFDAVEEWYYLHFKNECYLYYAAEDSILDATKDKIDRADREAYAWAFVGDPLNGFQVVNKKAAETMGLKAAQDGAVVGEGGHTFKLTASAYLENGFFMEATDGDVAKRFNLQNGKVVYWEGADLGSTFTVSVCPFGPVAELEALISEAEALKLIVDENTGDKIGEYSQATADALAAAIVVAQAKGDGATADDVTALQSVIDGTKVILPTAGKYYQLRSAVAFAETKAVYSNGSNPMWKSLNTNDKTFYWQAVENEGGIALKNAADGKYMNGNATQSGAWSVSDTPANIDVKIFFKEENANGYQYGVIIDNWQLHAAGHGGGSGTEGSIVSYNTDESGSASAWYLVEVELPQFYTITYNFKYDGVIKYTQTAIFAPGSEFPDFSVMLPYGVVIAAEKPAGTVTEDKTFDFDLKVEKELPFVAAASVDDINTWYYVQMHANSAVTAYLEDNGGNNIEWVDKSVESSEIDSYLWGYVGDVWNGIKMVNKGTGRAIVSTSGDAVLGDAAEATAFIPTNSQAGGNWFCLKYPESNYLNAQGSKVASYNDNDNGSSFLLTEYKVYALEVPSIGYGTFYSDNKLEIPETVQAYVATSVNAGEVILEQVTGVIPAHTGIIFSGGEGVHNFVVSAATATAEFETNLLRGTTTKTLITPEAGSTYYVLEEGAIGAGLYIATLTEEDGTAFYNNANEAYLLVQTPVDQSEPVLTFRFGKQDGTKIEEAELNTQLPTVIYDLTGRRIMEIVEKGIYIINGKKVVVK